MPALTLPILALPKLVRAVLGTRWAASPAPVPVPAVDRPLLPVVDPDPVPSAGPQAQGDVIVLPWPDFMAPHVRYLHTASSAPVHRSGLTLLDPHVLLAECGRVFWSWWPDKGPTLGTLVVPDGTVGRLAHDDHADLRIAPGVYTVRRQRRDVSGRIELAAD
jgi:hypothetical protein